MVAGWGRWCLGLGCNSKRRKQQEKRQESGSEKPEKKPESRQNANQRKESDTCPYVSLVASSLILFSNTAKETVIFSRRVENGAYHCSSLPSPCIKCLPHVVHPRPQLFHPWDEKTNKPHNYSLWSCTIIQCNFLALLPRAGDGRLR